MKKVMLMLILFSIPFAAVTAQTHNAVSLEDTALYDFLDLAEMKGYSRSLRAVRPYPKSYVVKTLEEIARHRIKMSPAEKDVLQEYYDKYVINEDKDFLKDGDLRLEGERFNLTIDADAETQLNAQLNELTDSSAEAWAGVGFAGDVTDYVSWNLEFDAGAMMVDNYDSATSYGPESYEPYTYTKTWDGGSHPLSSLNNYEGMPTDLSLGYSYNTEIAASFWDNQLDMRFGRLRRNWGEVGEGSLFLNADARPMMGIDGSFTPWKWLSVSFLIGELEYGEQFRSDDDYSIKGTSSTQQNMFSMLQVEITPNDWLYVSLIDSGVYLKRTELGYMHPLMSSFFFQNNVGDFDNMGFGGNLVLKKAGLGKAYASLFVDEAKLNQPDFFTRYANMYAYQVGAEAVLPGLSWSSLTLQYTKIEPYTYTHYTVSESPWYEGQAMETGYMNGGESLGYGLEPNSDEIMIKYRAQPKRGLTVNGRYRMVRHGTNAGSYYESWGWDGETDDLDADSDPDGAYGNDDEKDFLKDGVYEWYHILGIGGEWDLTSKGQPVAFGADYCYVFKYYTDYESNGDFSPINSGAYENEHRHIVSLYAKIYP